MKNVDAGFAKSKYLEVSKLRTRFNLSFYRQLEMGNKMIALDGIKKCLLVLETGEGFNQSYLIDLNNVVAVTVKKSYGSIRQGELRYKGMEEFLERIDMQFEFANDNKTISLTFYDHEIDDPVDRQKRDRNAKKLQMILSRMVGSKSEKTMKERNRLALVQLPLVTGSIA